MGKKATAADAEKLTINDPLGPCPAAIAKAALRPSIQAAIANKALLAGDFQDALTLDALVTELAHQAEQVSDQNNLGRLEGMLATQAHTLNVLFNRMLRQAWNNVGHYPDTVDKYMRLALRAQAQCRATAETLNEMKNPKPVAFVQQANIASGPQQVNNGVSRPVHEPARAGESEIQQNELLEHQENGNRLDLGAASLAAPGHPQLATVDAFDGAANGGR